MPSRDPANLKLIGTENVTLRYARKLLTDTDEYGRIRMNTKNGTHIFQGCINEHLKPCIRSLKFVEENAEYR